MQNQNASGSNVVTTSISSQTQNNQSTVKQAVNGPQILAKQGTKLSFKTFAIGC
jgi:hypothetical protein